MLPLLLSKAARSIRGSGPNYHQQCRRQTVEPLENFNRCLHLEGMTDLPFVDSHTSSMAEEIVPIHRVSHDQHTAQCPMQILQRFTMPGSALKFMSPILQRYVWVAVVGIQAALQSSAGASARKYSIASQVNNQPCLQCTPQYSAEI